MSVQAGTGREQDEWQGSEHERNPEIVRVDGVT